MTAAERKVRERYPEATLCGPSVIKGGGIGYEVVADATKGRQSGYLSLGYGSSKPKAWADAASHLPALVNKPRESK